MGLSSVITSVNVFIKFCFNMIAVNIAAPFHVACQRRSLPVIQNLQEAGANPDDLYKDGNTPLRVAVKEGFKNLFSLEVRTLRIINIVYHSFMQKGKTVSPEF